jgi:DNA polymerase-3 subunit gamma/tau
MGDGLALYRKYRPATFAEVKGQDHVTAPLRQALSTGRINHAYLFSGPRGCGKTSSARILARSLNCVNGPTPDPCGVCDSCVALAPSGPGSIDVIEIDAASHGGVDDARDLRERAFYAPVSGRYKIYIIDEAHMVTQQGFNALLKLVEEPPPHLIFIFATTEPEKVIGTIRSRTHHYPFRLFPPSVLRDLLASILDSEGVTYDPAVLPLVARAGAGSARDSLSILDQLLAGSDESGLQYDRAIALLGYTDASLLDEIVDAFAAADGAGVFRAVNKVIEGGHEPRRFALDLLDRLRDLIVLASVPDAIDTGLLDVPPERAEPLAAQASRFGMAGLTRAAEIVSTGLDQMRGATSARLLLELVCAQVLLPSAGTDELSLLARVERLENSGPPTAQPIMVNGSLTTQESGQRPIHHDHATSAAAPAPVPAAPPATSAGAPPAMSAAAPPAMSAAAPPATASAAPPAPRRAPAAEPPRASAAPSPAPPSAPPAPASPPPAARGEVTGDTLRADWDAVLDTVKAQRRVAWILLSHASVVSLEENILTLRFPRPGDVKGFQSSGYEDLLKSVLTSRYGLHAMIKAVSGGDAGRPPGGRPPQPPAASPVPQSTPPAPVQEAPRPAPERTAAATTARPVDNGEPPPWATGEPPPDDSFEPDIPDDSDMAAAPSAEVTGMELIQRELGGQIIAEIDE